MIGRKGMSLLLCAALLFAMLTGCMPVTQTTLETTPKEIGMETAGTEAGDAATKKESGVYFTDMGGNAISLPAPATRIVALTPADVEILFAIGAGETLVGCGEYCNYPAEAQSVPVMQTGTELHLEQLLAAKPEVLLLNPAMLATGSVAETQAQVDRLADAGVTVVVSSAFDIAGVYEAIDMLGALTGKAAEAQTLVSSMQEAFAEVSNVESAAGKTVYFEISPLAYGLWTAGAGTFMDEIAKMLGLTNCFSDVVNYAGISEEQVIARNPDYIVTITMYFGEGPTPEEEIMARPGWENVTAVQTGAILALQNDELSRPGPRLAEGAKLLCAFVDQAHALDNAA